MGSMVKFVGGLSIESYSDSKLKHTKHPRRPSIEELDAVTLEDRGNLGQKPAPSEPASPASVYAPGPKRDPFRTPGTSKTPNELESSQPPTPTHEAAASVVPSWSHPKMNKWRILCACLIYFGNGMSDSAPGALIPYIERWYNIGYAIVSMVWIANAAGFITAAFVTDATLGKFGRAKTLMGSEAFMIAAYVIISCAPPFPVMVVAYSMMGFGNAVNLALNNVFCANLADSTIILGLAHGSYGVGGIVAPLIATAMVSGGIQWSRFYLVALGVRTLCFFFAGWSFWSYEGEGVTQFANSLQQLATRQSGNVTKLHLLGRAIKNRTTLIGALFIFAYQGAEVSESGWFISYLINYRNGDPARVGYVTSGFWAGITVGRFTLTHVASRIGEKRSVLGLGTGVVVFQLMCWFIPNIIGEAVSVAILGLLLGPVYPCAATVFTKLLPGNMQTIAISFISSAGSSGGAIVPFITGLVAQEAGTFVLHPICIGAYALMLGCWTALPTVRKRAEE
ncbi:hypothetical protein DOTSEDRAFT_157675 [Dothistroma septosporum NZE10]|uniref:Major facilitator superfamily (MFS) profile domain-containing protein n=1 Tax=Dothistroma septosporum (strain NZE10 / CBS 128990) TaxID=675120 RepID=N1PEJ3_DOTSN|nr:hypothetical protein DOTSEDRAFT_157675 [Dothistroma septosporum NZE10]